MKMPDGLENLDPEVRCLALVGWYLQVWASMESSLSRVLHKALGLERLNGFVVTANIQLGQKITIARVSTRLSKKLSPEQVEHYHSVLKRVERQSANRNMLAHSIFWPSGDGKEVLFNVVRAREEIELPHNAWTVARFHEEVSKVGHLWFELSRLADTIGPIDPVNQLSLLNAPSP